MAVRQRAYCGSPCLLQAAAARSPACPLAHPSVPVPTRVPSRPPAVISAVVVGGNSSSHCDTNQTAASIQAQCYNVNNCTLGSDAAPLFAGADCGDTSAGLKHLHLMIR